jgi:hypothetical protein
LYSPINSFFLGVDRDYRLARILKRQDLCIDMFELRIAVGMLRAFLGFPVDLPTIPEPFEQPRNAARRNLMAHLTQRRRELGVALGYPQQWSHRVADRRRLQKLSQVLKQRRVLLDQCSSAPSRAPHPVRRSRKIEFLQPSPNRASSDPRCPRNRADPADARRPRLRRCKKASSSLIEPGAESLVADANRGFVYHPPRIRIILRPGIPSPIQ